MGLFARLFFNHLVTFDAIKTLNLTGRTERGSRFGILEPLIERLYEKRSPQERALGTNSEP